MSSKVILYCLLLFCFKYVASITFPEESVRQTIYRPNDLQSNRNIPKESWNRDADVSRTQNINSMTNSAYQHDTNKESETNRESYRQNYTLNKHEPSPLESLPMQEGPSDLESEPNIYPRRTDNQRYRQHNSPTLNNFNYASSASRSSITTYRSPLIPSKQNPYFVPNRAPIHHTRGNHQNINDDTFRPLVKDSYTLPAAKYSGNDRYMKPVDINLRSKNGAENYESNDEGKTKVRNYERNRYAENSPPHSAPSFLPSPSYYGAPHISDKIKHEGSYYNNERNRYLAHSQNNPNYNNPGHLPNRNIENFGNSKFLEYPPTNFKPMQNRYVNSMDSNATPSSGSATDNKSFQDVIRKTPTASNQKNVYENTKAKKTLSSNVPHGTRYMIIHKNGTIEYIDRIDENNKYSIVKNQYRLSLVPETSNDNDYRPSYGSPSNDDYNPENGISKSLDTHSLNSSDATTPLGALTKDELTHEPKNSSLSKSFNDKYLGPSSVDNNSNRTNWEKYLTTPQSDSYRHKTSTQNPEDIKIQEYLDSLSNNTDDPASAKPPPTTNKSTPVNYEDGSIEEFIDSLYDKLNSNQQSSKHSYGDNDSTTQATMSDSNSYSSATTISSVETTVADEIITISPIELATDNVNNQSSSDDTSNDDIKTNDDINLSSKDNDKKCHNSAGSDCVTNIDEPKNNDDSTTETTDTEKQSDVSDNSKTTNDLKLIINIPNDSAGTLKLTLSLPDNTGKESAADDRKLQINIDTKDYRESDFAASKKNETIDNNNDKSGVEKEKKDTNTLIELLNSVAVWNKMTDKDFINQLPSDNSTVNLWYLIQMQPQCQPIVEKSKVTTIYPNGTIVEELTETTWQNNDDQEPTIVKTTRISYKDRKKH